MYEWFTHTFFLLMFSAGFAALCFPQKIQESAIKQGRFDPFKNWTRSRAYIWTLRACGMFTMALVIILEFFLLTGNS
jgi:hypothetical protein